MPLTKETFTGKAYLTEQLEILRKYVYNVSQRHQGEARIQRELGIPNTLSVMGGLVDEVVNYRSKECDKLNHKFGGNQ